MSNLTLNDIYPLMKCCILQYQDYYVNYDDTSQLRNCDPLSWVMLHIGAAPSRAMEEHLNLV